MSAAPLAGVRVVEVAELLPGPFFTHCLADLGAEIVKVERPGTGDPMRAMRPASYEVINHRKRVVQHDLRTPKGVEAVLALVADADVFVEGSRPGVTARLGLGWERLAELNERLVYVSLTGFGWGGPIEQVPGHDLNYQAVAGLLALGGTPDCGPQLGNLMPVSDYAGASYALSATLAALLQRTSTGRGQWLDVSITDAVGHWVLPFAAHLRSQGLVSFDQVRGTLQERAGYGTFRCADRDWLAIGALEPRFLARLLEALDLAPDLAREAPAALNEAVSGRLGVLPAAQALELMVAHDVPATRVATPVEYAEGGPAGRRDGFPVRLAGLGGD